MFKEHGVDYEDAKYIKGMSVYETFADPAPILEETIPRYLNKDAYIRSSSDVINTKVVDMSHSLSGLLQHTSQLHRRKDFGMAPSVANNEIARRSAAALVARVMLLCDADVCIQPRGAT
jgi:hypothetical protein